MQKIIHHINGLEATVILGNALRVNEWVSNVDLIITSPPYADARKKHYTSIKPGEYATWFARFSTPFTRCLRKNGSLVINIKDKVVNGRRSRYVWETMLEYERRGWWPIEDYVWHKTTAYPGYWPTRFRDAWEYCFHLARDKRPYFDHSAALVPAAEATIKRAASSSPRDHKRTDSMNDTGMSTKRDNWAGVTRVQPTNVLYTSPDTAPGHKHPVVFPLALPAFFIPFLSPPGGLILDPFGGSGTTAIAALNAGRNCVIVEKEQKYFDLINERVSAWSGT